MGNRRLHRDAEGRAEAEQQHLTVGERGRGVGAVEDPQKTSRTAWIETTLLAIGAHIIGPNLSRAFNTCPASTCTP